MADSLLAFSIGILYVAWLRFIPFIVCWYFIQRDPKHESSMRLHFVVGVTVMLAALSGYDNITNTIVSCSLPSLYYGWRDARPLGQTLWHGLSSVIAGCLGLVAAIVAHTVALVVHFGSLAEAMAVFLDRARDRMGLSELGGNMSDGYDRFAAEAMRKLPAVGAALSDAIAPYLPYVRGLLRWIRYLLMDAVTIVLPGGREFALPIVLFLALSIAVAIYVYVGRAGRDDWQHRQLTALAGVTLAGFGVSNLWAILFHGHMNHIHLNAIIFFMPFLLLAFALTGVVIERGAVRFVSLCRLGRLASEGERPTRSPSDAGWSRRSPTP